MRVRVTLDVYQPLCRGRVIKLEDGEKIWVSFKYERLPNICYWCGCLDHGDKDCDIWIQSRGTLQVSSQQFGAWLRAPPNVSTNNRVIRVSGYFENRKENISMQRRKAAKQGPIPVPALAKESQVDKEKGDTEAEILEEQVLKNQPPEPNKEILEEQVSSPASHNELHSLELPRAWEPSCSSRACGFGAGKSSLSRVLSRNMGR